MSEVISIYDRIRAALQADGTLPEDFILKEREVNENGLSFAPGAMDGIIRYHMGPTNSPDISSLTLVLEMASAERYQDAVNALLTYFEKGNMMLPVMDALQEWVFENPERLSPERLGSFAMSLLYHSPDVESVKFALTILELLEQEPAADLKEVILLLATSEELTLFCLFLLAGYDDAMEQIFLLAKKLRGWGRVHAISMLKPVDEEMSQWLLEEGWQNDIMLEYSALTIIKRTGLLQRLGKEEGYKLFSIAGRLIDGALSDTPVPGLGTWKKGEELLKAYLTLAKIAEKNHEDYGIIFDIMDFLKDKEAPLSKELYNLSQEILQKPSCKEVILKAMEAGEGFYLAKSLGIEFASYAMSALKDDWENRYDLVELLFLEKEYRQEAIDLLTESLPLEVMATGPAMEMGTGEEYKYHGILSYVVQALQNVPGKGEELLLTALYSPVIGCRNIAISTLEKWRKADFQLTEALRERISLLQEEEVHEETKKRLAGF